MHRRLSAALLAVSLSVGCGGTGAEPASGPVQQQQAPLTEADVDVAPECQGILTFVNTASFEALDTYLPSDFAANLVARRGQSPLVSLEDILSVQLAGPARLQQILVGARAQGHVGTDCVGIQDDLAISTEDEARMVALVNSISSTELHDILPYAWNGAVNLLNLRPFTSAQGISGTAGIGSVSFRNIRNAATLSRPLEQLIDAANALAYGDLLARHFDWFALVKLPTDHRHFQLQCFGYDADDLPWGATVIPAPTAQDIHDQVDDAVDSANASGQLDPALKTRGMANLDALIAGRTFKGCIVASSTAPESKHITHFYVDKASGFSVKTETSYWLE